MVQYFTVLSAVSFIYVIQVSGVALFTFKISVAAGINLYAHFQVF